VSLKPEWPETHNNLGAGWFLRGDLVKASAAFDEAIRRDPANAEAYFNRGRVFAAQRRSAEALVAFRASLKLKSTLFFHVDLITGDVPASFHGRIPSRLNSRIMLCQSLALMVPGPARWLGAPPPSRSRSRRPRSDAAAPSAWPWTRTSRCWLD
jgi:tetratricopeptide (TPR) repeat protein